MVLVEKNAIIKSINAKLSFNALRTKVNNINVLQPMAFLQHLPRATQGNCLSALLVKVKLNVTF